MPEIKYPPWNEATIRLFLELGAALVNDPQPALGEWTNQATHYWRNWQEYSECMQEEWARTIPEVLWVMAERLPDGIADLELAAKHHKWREGTYGKQVENT